ncbi:MAG: hypothetical protein V4812_15895, partial [Pseudomonadota bacterium]
VVNLPTKHYYVPVDGNTTPALAPFASKFSNGQACEASTAYMLILGRDGESLSDMEFMHGDNLICSETSVLTFNDSQVLASAHAEGVGVLGTGSNGTAWLELYGSRQLESLEGHRYFGLPMSGFMVRDFINGNVNGVLSSYGGSFAHKYGTSIEVP